MKRRLPAVIVILALCVLTFSAAHGWLWQKEQPSTRPPYAAGSFYPADPAALRAMVNGFLLQAPPVNPRDTVLALVAPHAGYAYSGTIAARAFGAVKGRTYKRVVVIAPSHIGSFPFASIYSGRAYATPLGEIPVDTSFAEKLAAASPRLKLSDEGHGQAYGRGEHALEAELPFLQESIGPFKLVPVVMGAQTYDIERALGVALAELIAREDSGKPDTLIVASSDLSHYHPYDEAVALDRSVLGAIRDNDYFTLSLNAGGRVWEACGGGPIVAAMIAAGRLGANENRILAYANSGDTTGDKSRVVGYGAAALIKSPASRNEQSCPPPLMSAEALAKADGEGLGAGYVKRDISSSCPGLLTPGDRATLLKLAMQSAEAAVRGDKPPPLPADLSPALLTPRGAFVTLKERGQLRGCIGHITPDAAPLVATVRAVAALAATSDRRFRPVAASELPSLDYEISVLSPLRRVADPNNVKIGRDGLLIRLGDAEGVFLPQVPVEQHWNLATYLDQLAVKANLPPNSWQSPGADLFSFQAEVFGEK